MNKNWKAICGIEDQWLRMALGLLDLGSLHGAKVAAALPEYFSEKGDDGPIPWSVLHRKEADDPGALDEICGRHDIPLMEFDRFGSGHGYPHLPKPPIEFEHEGVGARVTYLDKDMIVIENGDRFTLVPAERIALDR